RRGGSVSPPLSVQRLHRRAERCQLEWFLDELERAGRSSRSGDFGRNRGTDNKNTRRWLGMAQLFQQIGYPVPRRIDIADKELGAKSGREFFELLKRVRDNHVVLGREFL